MIPVNELSDPTVRSVVTAINAGDRQAFLAAFVDDPTMSDDGTERDFQDWIDREIFSSNGRMDVETQSHDGRSLIARYRNDTYGQMRTSWTFAVVDDRVTRMECGQA
jgi:hypothetical protein